jgi:hypothetical protein
MSACIHCGSIKECSRAGIDWAALVADFDSMGDSVPTPAAPAAPAAQQQATAFEIGHKDGKVVINVLRDDNPEHLPVDAEAGAGNCLPGSCSPHEWPRLHE